MVHRPGNEPGPPAWQASILPLNHRLGDYMKSYRKFVGLAAIFAKQEPVFEQWIESSEILRYKVMRDRMIVSWRTLKTTLKEKGGEGSETSETSSFRVNTQGPRSAAVATGDQSEPRAPLRFPGEHFTAGTTLARGDATRAKPLNDRLFEGQSIGLNREVTSIRTPDRVPSWETPILQRQRPHRRQPERVNLQHAPEYLTPHEQNIEALLSEMRTSRVSHPRTAFSNIRTEHPKFSGEITEFRAWYTSFQDFVGLSQESTYVKLLQLRELLTGEAKQKVFGGGLQIRGESYPLAVKRLLDEYDDPDRLERGFYERLGRIQCPSLDKLDQVRSVYEEIMMIIVTMGESADNMGLKIIIERKFPSEIIVAVTRQNYLQAGRARESLQVLLNSIDCEISALERVARLEFSKDLPRAEKKSRISHKQAAYAVETEKVDDIWSDTDEEDYETMTAQTFAVFQQDKRRAKFENKQNWGNLNNQDRIRAQKKQILHVCNLCDARQKRHYEHKCPKYSDFESRMRKIKSEKRCVKCFELQHRETDVCPRERVHCLIEQCTEKHGLAACEKYYDFINENKGNFSLRSATSSQK